MMETATGILALQHCKTTSPLSLGVDCPKPGCGGYLTEKRSRRGKTFFGCSNYSRTKCDFVSWDRPLPQACPKCGAKFVVQKVSKAGVRIRCVNEGCDYTADPEAQESAPPAEAAPAAAPATPAPTDPTGTPTV